MTKTELRHKHEEWNVVCKNMEAGESNFQWQIRQKPNISKVFIDTGQRHTL